MANELEKPVIIKETGGGIAAEEAKKLEAVGVKGIDVGGAGGTSFAAVEYYRAKEKSKGLQGRLGYTLWDWGIPTAASIFEVCQTVKIPVIGSGGIRNGLEIAKALALGASLTSFSQPILEKTIKGVKETKEMLTYMIEELRSTMFLVGASSIQALSETPLVITGGTAEWLRTREFDLRNYANRGRDQVFGY
jgi:isopentenyl-diphosphate delta-isomerase